MCCARLTVLKTLTRFKMLTARVNALSEFQQLLRLAVPAATSVAIAAVVAVVAAVATVALAVKILYLCKFC
jgi:ABC-type transport system involved in cytochrome bd biosynthesis fused ATPase/permease subunit